MTRAPLALMILTVWVGASVARAQESVSLPGTWTDLKTRLMWATKDNGGSDTTYAQAVEYCQKLKPGWFQGLATGQTPRITRHLRPPCLERHIPF